MATSKSRKLTDQQELFAREYVKDRNGKRAATRAGYSEKTAASQASRLLTNVKVRARVDFLIAKQFERTEVTTERIFDEMAAVAFSNIGHYANVNGRGGVDLFPWESIPLHGLAAVAEVSETVTQHGGTRRIKMHDKLGTLRDLAKLKGLDADDTPEERAAAIAEAMESLGALTFVDPPEEDAA